MKKIGILTLVSADNCGSQLQAYALRHILRNTIHRDAELLNYHPSFAERMYKVLHLSYLKSPVRLLLMLPTLIKQRLAYNKFRKKNLGLDTLEIRNDLELTDYCNQLYDEIIVGSDQVWNVNMADFTSDYFLGWYSGTKYSYAASLGGTENVVVPKELKSYIKHIECFENISVREPQGKAILQQIVDRQINVHIDPTLLVEPEDWANLAGERIVKQEYIFYYSYNYADDTLNKLVQRASDQLHLPVYVINASRWVNKSEKKYGFKLCKQAGPLAFLSLMKHAKYVFVQSLHGAIFAYVFKTDFWFLNNRETDIIDQRSENILTLLGKRNRTIRPNTFEETILTTPCVYDDNAPLQEKRLEAIKYLAAITN